MSIIQSLLNQFPISPSFHESILECVEKNEKSFVLHGGAALSMLSLAIAVLVNQKWGICLGSGIFGFAGGYCIKKLLGKNPYSIKLLDNILKIENKIPHIRLAAFVAAFMITFVIPVAPAPAGLVCLGLGFYDGFVHSL